MARTPSTPSTRDRILDTADRLFYREGVRAVGIDRVIAEAGVAKMSLYNHFPSKDDLILAVLERREETFQAWFQAAMARHEKKLKNPLRAFFAALKDWFETPDFRGCAFQNATVELADRAHPAVAFARGHKGRFAEFLRGVVGKSSAASAVGLLVEGAIVTALIQGSSAPAGVARDAALALVRDRR